MCKNADGYLINVSGSPQHPTTEADFPVDLWDKSLPLYRNVDP